MASSSAVVSNANANADLTPANGLEENNNLSLERSPLRLRHNRKDEDILLTTSKEERRRRHVVPSGPGPDPHLCAWESISPDFTPLFIAAAYCVLTCIGLGDISLPAVIGIRLDEAKNPSLTLNLGTNGLKVTSGPPPMAGQVGCLQGQDRSAVTHPSSSHARRCLIWLSCDNRCTRYTAPLKGRTEKLHPSVTDIKGEKQRKGSATRAIKGGIARKPRMAKPSTRIKGAGTRVKLALATAPYSPVHLLHEGLGLGTHIS
ncbi:hypothetical protein J6590_042075 [Homalodisca vitripennis]|nr:hypothetical protein J6590_042075 [Homalodisca vitripennis]